VRARARPRRQPRTLRRFPACVATPTRPGGADAPPGARHSILYYQRDAPKAFQVTSNLVTQFVPGVSAFSALTDITDWLSGQVGAIWTDPVCGDGKCEQPFEFPTYGRFGCKADCGVFTDLFANVTGVQVDFFFDFTHPAGSTPATTLLQQATWNMCPQEDSSVNGPAADPPLPPVPHGQACYYAQDVGFSALTGHDTAVLPDVPDGLWQITINGDLFNKVSGTARNLATLTTAATDIKQQLAAYAVWRANTYELGTLNGAPAREQRGASGAEQLARLAARAC
jgi:hypothetical protein